MKRILSAAMLAAFVAPVAAPAFAGPIERACLASPRKESSRPLCNCIGQVANQMLSSADQRKAAKFFKDPHSAQEVRQSDRRADERFWERYVDFGSTAAAVCG
ncbi:hypothetical protein [Thalassovita sp.]|uniref:hypothetical protein n=1 Tax=Thalassovita sp. TaxID=1979401 RepID=UPI002AAF8E50|nr:hypothetical protein [Thalassovita sp.]